MNVRMIILLFCLFIFSATTGGCGDSSKGVTEAGADLRPETLAWFDELSRRATQRDYAYVRARVSPHLLTSSTTSASGAPPRDPAEGLCDAIMYSYAIDQLSAGDGKKITLAVGCVAPGLLGGSSWAYSIDLHRDGGQLKLDSWPYDQRPLSPRTDSTGQFSEK